MTYIRYSKLKDLRKALLVLCFALLMVSGVSAQKITVRGIVVDETGRAISKVLVKVGNQTDSTDLKGKFEVAVTKGDILNISKTGFVSQMVSSASLVKVTLTTVANDKRVETLFQSLPLKEVTSSISVLTSKSLSNNSVLALGNALYGRIPGLNVKQSVGEPGDDYPSLLIRGRHTFTGSNSPLVLVDGFEREFNTLSIEEVQSISVLKDAASTALYGMDGANGIVLVTTKRGLPEKATADFKVEFGVKAPTRLPEFYGSYDYARLYNQAQKNDGKTSFMYSDDQLEGYRLNQDPMLYPNVNWMDETLRKYAPSRKYNANFRGGNQVVRYFINVGVENSDGLYKNSDHGSYSTNRNLDRINFRSNIDVNVTKRFSVSLDLSGRLENINAPTNSSTNIFNNFYVFHPNVSPVYVLEGVYGGTNTYRNNPVAYINELGYTETHRRYFQSNIIGKYDFSDLVKGLSLGIRASFDNFYTVTDGYTKTYAVKQILDKISPVDSLSDFFGINSNLVAKGPTSETELRSTNLEFFAAYESNFGKHKIAAMAMGHQDEYVTTTAFPDRRISVSGKVSWGYNQKYFVDLAAQYGATEHFKKWKRFGFFPAISGAWIVSSEDFMKDSKPVSYLKLRASTGLVGNQNVGGTRFGYRMLYNSNGTEMPIGNPNLTWEKSYKTDIGLDATLFGEVQVMLNYFHEFRDDILNSGDALMPAYFGNSFGYTNYGQVKSNGFEASVLKEHQYLDWGYHFGANVSFVKNKIVRMREVSRKDTYLYRQGLPVGQRFGLVALGLFQNQAEIDAAPVQTFGKVIPGSIRYLDVNGDKVINSDDSQPIGKDATIPDMDLGFNLGLNFKGFYLDANFQASVGRDVNLRDNTEGAQYSVAPLYSDKNISTFVKNPWTPETAATADYPSLSIENAANNFQYSTFWLRSGDFLRLRTLEIGYNLPKNLISKLKMSAAKIYLRGMNVFTLDHIKYFDPEVMEGYPVMKSYNIGINFNF